MKEDPVSVKGLTNADGGCWEWTRFVDLEGQQEDRADNETHRRTICARQHATIYLEVAEHSPTANIGFP